MKIYLIGMPGSGKTTLGHPLAQHLNVDFIDQDKEIENHTGQTVQQIFETQGEDHFRQIESMILRECALSSKSFVMATGGGAPCFYNGLEIMNQSGISVFLDTPVKELLERLKHNDNRPLLQSNDVEDKAGKLKTLHEKRLPVYQQAHVHIVNATVKSLLQKLNLKR